MKKRLPLQSFRLQNFKAVRDSGTVRFGPLTVFIGNNGSGKSSLIEGLETFLDVVLNGLDKAMSRWRGFEHVWNHAVKHELRRLPERRPHHTNPMTFQIQVNADAYRIKGKQEINIGEGGNELFIQAEEARRGVRRHQEHFTRDSFGIQTLSIDAELKPFSFGPTQMSPKYGDGQSLLTDLVGQLVERWQFLSLAPERMGDPMPQQRAGGRTQLARSGANVAEYLNEMRKVDLEAFAGLFEALQFVLPFAADLQPTLTSELERTFYLKLKEGDFEVPGWLLSTGTLRIVALLACLRHPEPPPLLVVEEIENGLDPRTLHMVVEEIRAAVSAGKTQVIATTHSPYLLDLLDLSHIVVVEREDGEPRFKRPNEDELAEWSKSFSPGRLYTMGRLTRND
jgi:predicted ATPase